MRSKALLFGINYERHKEAELRGCVNDVKNMSRYLSDKGKYDKISVYTDEYSDKRVTGNFIISKLYKLAIDSHRYKLERVWIHFSGHGCSIKDNNRDEIDMKDECILPVDYRTKGVITDDLIRRIFRYFNKNTKVICIFDCCHSGSIGDLKYEYETEDTIKRINLKSRCSADITMISGCMDHQTSVDAYNVRGKYEFSGAMTSCLLSSLCKEDNIIDVYENLKTLLKEKGFKQKPLLSSSYKLTKTTQMI